ncbi:hypothetical protein SAMN04488542_10550 [Fontibacillus panacisegetis]|uniref:Uncharacterized protein n=1 Tax=Fontibacillus panacisegetis TaxID=670482 RepID=A0A1G7HVV0_9BACL|nr:hypothetical protein [Fontibacillus panacisegetis]SDF04386.1 hypothetical protein SAMN04488542_10550 [Fontibacillus panacisegetis]
MKKDKKFNIIEINGTKPINEWLERNIEKFAKREYGLNITVNVIKVVKERKLTEDIQNTEPT